MQKFHKEKIRRRDASLEKTLLGTSFSSTMHMVHGWPPSWLRGQQEQIQKRTSNPSNSKILVEKNEANTNLAIVTV